MPSLLQNKEESLCFCFSFIMTLFFFPFLGFFINHFAFVNLYMDYFFRFYSKLSAEYV